MKVVNLNASNFEQVINSVVDNYEPGDSISFAMTKRDLGEVHTAWLDADVGKKNELVGHLQADIMMAMVQINFVED